MIEKENSAQFFNNSVQINDGFCETSADGACLAFDKKYGIMFCAYMPGKQCCYGESRGKIKLSYFPATQPANIRYITVAEGRDEYCNNILSLGDGKVRIFYETNSYADCDHDVCYRDFDFMTETLSEEKVMMLKGEGGKLQKLHLSAAFSYLEARGYHNHKYLDSEQISIGGGGSFCTEDDGFVYGAVTSYLQEPVLFRSDDNLATVEFFAICPYAAQYEFDYKFLNGKIYAIFRTDKKENGIAFTMSNDMGSSWTEPVAIEESINCRPRLMHYDGGLLMAYNYSNRETENKRIHSTNRTAIKLRLVDNDNPNRCTVAADLVNTEGIVNISLAEILGNVYLAYSTSEAPLEYINYDGPDDPVVHGKDAMRYVKLGYLGKR